MQTFGHINCLFDVVVAIYRLLLHFPKIHLQALKPPSETALRASRAVIVSLHRGCSRDERSDTDVHVSRDNVVVMFHDPCRCIYKGARHIY